MQPGEIVLPTPVIRRARGQQFSSPIQQPAFTSDRANTRGTRPSRVPGVLRTPSFVSALEAEMSLMRGRISSTRFCLYESILRALHALLTATADPSPSTRGSKSLLAMCLRKVPEYIGELEDWKRREAEEQGTKSMLQNSESSNEVYEAVEAMLPPGQGCPQLRTVVRAHGLKVVRDAITDGLMDDKFSILLLKLCSTTNSFSEAEGLLEVILDRPYPKPKGVDSTFDEVRRLAPLKELKELVKESGRPQFMLRQLSKLVSSQQLPLNWLPTKEFSSVWCGIVKALSGNEVCHDTMSFAILMITTLSSQSKTEKFTLKPEANDLKSLTQQTLLSAVTAMASLPLLRKGAPDLLTHLTASIAGRVGFILQTCIYELRRTRKPGWISTVLRLAAYFTSSLQDSSRETDISDLWAHIIQNHDTRDGKQHYEAVTALVCHLAQCCGRGTSEPSHYYLTKLCDQLDSVVVATDEAPSRKLRIDCAFFLAERTNDLRDLAFAESFNTITTTEGQTARRTPRKETTSSSFTGFRWDEGISEWVTATPAEQQRRSSSAKTYLSPDSEEETRHDSGAELNSGDDDDRQSLFDGVSDQGDSAKRASSHRYPKRSRVTTRARGCAQQGVARLSGAARLSANLLRTRKRDFTSYSDTEEDEEADEDEVPRSSVSTHRRGLGQENSVVVEGPSTKRRRVTSLKPHHRSVLRTITNTGREELSDDELGL